MSEHYFSFASLTHAYQAKDVLKRNGIPSRVIPTPKAAGLPGCSFSLLLLKGESEAAAELLRQKRMRILYRQ